MADAAHCATFYQCVPGSGAIRRCCAPGSYWSQRAYACLSDLEGRCGRTCTTTTNNREQFTVQIETTSTTTATSQEVISTILPEGKVSSFNLFSLIRLVLLGSKNQYTCRSHLIYISITIFK